MSYFATLRDQRLVRNIDMFLLGEVWDIYHWGLDDQDFDHLD